MLAIVQTLTTDMHTRWRDLLFYIKKGANWSFPLQVEGIKSDFYKVHVWNINPRRGKKTAVSNKKDLKLSAK